MANPRVSSKTLELDVTKQCVAFLQAHGWRPIRMSRGVATFGNRGTVTFGEPGMPDWLFLRYGTGREFLGGATGPRGVLWIEFKRPGDKRGCICATKPPRKRCTVCDQDTWRVNEQVKGATVLRVASFDELLATGKWK